MVADPPFDSAADPDSLRSFIGELERAGYVREDDWTWTGPTDPALISAGYTTAERMGIRLRVSWPYLPPLLIVPGISNWHADQERLCIWQAEDASQRWTTLDGLSARIAEWVEDADLGFARSENARNPEIYWQQPMPMVAGLVDLEGLLSGETADGQHGEFQFADAVSADGRPSPGAVYDLRPGAYTAGSPLPGGVNYGQVRGRWFLRENVSGPPRNLDEFRSLLTDRQRERLDKDLRDRAVVMFGLIWRNNAGLVATMLLSVRGADGARETALVALRPNGPDELLLRAGPDAATLQGKRVAILGVGAVGSHVAELLARAGVGTLRLVDSDRLWPANLIRHAAAPGTPAATLKTHALQADLEQYPWVRVEVPAEDDYGIKWSIDGLRELLADVDVTVEATGFVGLSQLAGQVAAAQQRPLVSAALFRGGTVARVRRQALPSDTLFIRRPHLDAYPEITPLEEEVEYVGSETGCLALVHNSPPIAVVHAAALASEVVVDFLVGRNEQPDEVIEVLRSGPVPFHRVGRLRRTDMTRTIDVVESALASMRSAASAAAPNETGGVLVGALIDARPVVTAAVEVSDPGAAPQSFRIAAHSVPRTVEPFHDADERLGYLGEWHSHTGPEPSGPSHLDVASMLALAEESGTDEPVLVIVHADTRLVRGHVVTEGQLIPADICEAGDLPAASPEACA